MHFNLKFQIISYFFFKFIKTYVSIIKNQQRDRMVDCYQYLLFKILMYYGTWIFIYGTIITTTLCIIIFTRIVLSNSATMTRNDNSRSQMFLYFLVKSISDLIAFLCLVPEYFYISFEERSYWWQMWYIWFYKYLLYSTISFSNYMEIAATLDCYLMLKNKYKFLLTKKIFYTVIAVNIAMTLLIEMYQIFTYEIVINDSFNNNTFKSYQINPSNFSQTAYYDTLNYVSVMYREIMPLAILSIINVFILLLIKETSNRKKMTQGYQRNVGIAIHNAEMNKIKMILIISFSYIILRLPHMFYQLKPKRIGTFWDCFYFPISIRFYDFSFLIQLFNYYFFNKTFRKSFHNMIRIIKRNEN
jgi:hypothetical protein